MISLHSNRRVTTGLHLKALPQSKKKAAMVDTVALKLVVPTYIFIHNSIFKISMLCVHNMLYSFLGWRRLVYPLDKRAE